MPCSNITYHTALSCGRDINIWGAGEANILVLVAPNQKCQTLQKILLCFTPTASYGRSPETVLFFPVSCRSDLQYRQPPLMSWQIIKSVCHFYHNYKRRSLRLRWRVFPESWNKGNSSVTFSCRQSWQHNTRQNKKGRLITSALPGEWGKVTAFPLMFFILPGRSSSPKFVFGRKYALARSFAFKQMVVQPCRE